MHQKEMYSSLWCIKESGVRKLLAFIFLKQMWDLLIPRRVKDLDQAGLLWF